MKYQNDLETARNSLADSKTILARLKRKRPKNLDDQFHDLHEEVFEEIDCLECANCCKTTSPIFIMSDIERIAAREKMSARDFITTYLKLDEEGDYVLKSSPCPFLLGDNTCIIYKDRPRACREYPHTNRKRMHQILDLTLSNTMVCPAVFRIVQRLQTKS